MDIGLLTALLFGSMLVLMALGLPVGFAIGAVAMFYTHILWGPQALVNIAIQTFSTMSNLVLIAGPLYIFMANMLERSGVADDLYTMMHRWMGPLRGGLAIGTVLICTIFAAMSGVSAAATVTMGIIALPQMLQRHYDKGISIGCIMAGGALGQLIPPSVIMVLYAVVAQQSVGKLFAGGVIPGLILSALFCIYILVRCGFQRTLGPGLPPEDKVGWNEKFVSLKAVILPIFIVLAVLGSIFSGMATPTEAAAVGAAAAVISGAIYRKLTWNVTKEACYRTLSATSMIMLVIIASACLGSVYTKLGATELIGRMLLALPGGRWAAMIVMQLILMLLGCVLHSSAIVMICGPLFAPLAVAFGFDPIWFGIIFVVNMELSYLTPPVGSNLFFMKAVAPKEITMGDIYRAAGPFVGIQFLGLVICMIFPITVTWLPSIVMG